jgi:segregation and condensation protein B
MTWVTTAAFLDHFGLAAIGDLPGLNDLAASGFLDTRPAVAVLPGHAGSRDPPDPEEEPGSCD